MSFWTRRIRNRSNQRWHARELPLGQILDNLDVRVRSRLETAEQFQYEALAEEDRGVALIGRGARNGRQRIRRRTLRRQVDVVRLHHAVAHRHRSFFLD